MLPKILSRTTNQIRHFSSFGSAAAVYVNSVSISSSSLGSKNSPGPTSDIIDKSTSYSTSDNNSDNTLGGGTGTNENKKSEKEEFKDEKDLLNSQLDELDLKKKQASLMTPPELVSILDKHVIGQAEAKRAMASAIRYRWRRQQLKSEEHRDQCTPRNILMIGPTGCGKTEIARRLAKILDAPFVIAEATKFTEVGFHGRDIESVMRDLMESGLRLMQKKMEKELRPIALESVEKKLLEALLGELQDEASQETWLSHLRRGWVDDRTVYIEVPIISNSGSAGQGAGGLGTSSGDFPGSDSYSTGSTGSSSDYGSSSRGGSSGGSNRSYKTRKARLTIREAREKLLTAELELRINPDDVIQQALSSVQNSGIIFIDEIDKIVSAKGSYGPDASSEGVQRDLLPIIEGTSIPTKYGNIKSDHVLFVCAGSFHSVRPSDMLAELQGRLPIRMNLHPLSEHDFYRILTEPEFGIIAQIQALLATEGCELVFTECGLKEVSHIAQEMNTYIENIGARRLHTVLEKVTDELSFSAAEYCGETVTVDAEFVKKKLSSLDIDRTQKGLL